MPKKNKKTTKKTLKAIEKPLPEGKEEGVKKTKIRVIGIGGGGGSIVSELASRVRKASFVAANTDLQALRGTSKKVDRFLFGHSLTRGLGTGMDVGLAETAAENEKDKIKKLLQGQDLVILVATLGGGVGAGATSVFARISKSLGNMTYGIFTLPFKFEGERKMEIARTAIEQIRPRLNAISIMPNERIFQIIDKSTPLEHAFSMINKNLASSLEGLLQTIYEPGLINIDFADLKTVLQGQGRLTYLNTVEVMRKDGSAKEAIEKVINSLLYPYGIKGAKGVLLNIAGEKSLPLSEVTYISKTISDQANKDAKIIFGVAQGKQYQNVVKTTLLATGCGMKIFPAIPQKRKSIKKAIKKRVVRRKKTSVIKNENPVSKKRKKPARIATRSVAGGKKSSKGLINHLNIFKKKTKKNRKAKRNKPQKLKIRFLKKETLINPEQEMKKENPAVAANLVSQNNIVEPEFKIRKNALQLKKEVENTEKEMIEQEKFWEIPSFLKRKTEKG